MLINCRDVYRECIAICHLVANRWDFSFSAAPGTLGMPGIQTRALLEDDGGEATGGRAVGRVERGGGPEGVEKSLRTSQSAG